MKFVVILVFILASLLLEADSLHIKAHFPPKSAKRQSRLVLSGTLPPLREITICHWINSHGYRPNGMYIVSYVHGESSNELLTGIVHEPRESDSYSDYMKLVLGIRNVTNPVGRVYVDEQFRFLGKWKHLCFTWSSGGGLAEAYLDGNRVGRSSLSETAGQEIRAGGVLMIGQDQDIYNGKFDPDQAWDGYISEVHIWDERLSKKQISALSKCGKQQGNVFAWMKSPLTAEDGVILSGANLCHE